jgi:hypothetical protein
MLIQTGRRTRFYLDLAKVFARLLNNENQPQIRPELVRELWDLQKFLINIHHPILIQIIFSLLSRLYSLILVEQSHVDIYSEYSRYWPTSIDYRQRSIYVHLQ